MNDALPVNRDDWRFQIRGSLANGFQVLDMQTGTIVATSPDRLGANNDCAKRNREYYTTPRKDRER